MEPWNHTSGGGLARDFLTVPARRILRPAVPGYMPALPNGKTTMLKRIFLGLSGLLLFVVVLVVATAVVLQPAEPPARSIEFTRFLATTGVGAESTASFTGIDGPGTLQVSCGSGEHHVAIRLNGEDVLSADQPVACSPGFSKDLTLRQSNTLEIRTPAPLPVTGEPPATAEVASQPVTIRIRQRADVKLHVLSRVHFNTNVRNFEASRAFYGTLGFSTLSGFPDTNTQEMARAIGIETPTSYDGSKGDWAGGYLLHGELIGLGFMSGAIDLIEFTIPRDDAPPYARLNHLGMARAVLHTGDLDADYERLTTAGVRFLSKPAIRSDGTRFVIFTDPDGTFYELAEAPDPRPDDARTPAGTDIHGFGPLNVNVSDFERSLAWYAMFGYELTRNLEPVENLDVANAMGFSEPVERRGAILTHDVDGSTLELVQWLKPFDPERAYPIPVNHIGIHRTALSTTDIVADVATLKAQGVEFVSPITPCCSGPDASGSIVAFYDPDGTIVELVEQPVMTWVTPVMLKIRDWLR